MTVHAADSGALQRLCCRKPNMSEAMRSQLHGPDRCVHLLQRCHSSMFAPATSLPSLEGLIEWCCETSCHCACRSCCRPCCCCRPAGAAAADKQKPDSDLHLHAAMAAQHQFTLRNGWRRVTRKVLATLWPVHLISIRTGAGQMCCKSASFSNDARNSQLRKKYCAILGSHDCPWCSVSCSVCSAAESVLQNLLLLQACQRAAPAARRIHHHSPCCSLQGRLASTCLCYRLHD